MVSVLLLLFIIGVFVFVMLFVGVLFDVVGCKLVMVVLLLFLVVLVLVIVLVLDWYMLLVLCMLFGFILSGLLVVVMIYFSEEMYVDFIGLGMGLYIVGNVIGGMGG